MKCAVALSVLLVGCSVLLGDSPNLPPSTRRPASALLDDLVRMTRAGSSDASVLAYARAHRMELPSEVSDARLRWLRDSGVSERVVRYMAAIDVRASAIEAPEGVTDAGDEEERLTRPRAGYSSESDDDRDSGNVLRRDVESEAGGSDYRHGDSDAYADSDYGNGYGNGYDYGYGYNPYFGYPYPYSFFPAYFVGRGDFFRRFPHRDRRDRRDHRFDGGRRGGVADRGGFHESWRDRGSRGRRGGPMAGDRRGSERSAVTRAFRPGARGRAIGPRGFGLRGPVRGNSSPGFRGPRGGAGAVSGFRHPAPPGGSHPRTGGGFNRGAPGMHGGGRGRR